MAWLQDTYARTLPGKGKVAQVRRCGRVHNATTKRASQITRGIARDAWAKLTPEERTAWKTGTVEMAANRDNKQNGIRNGWIYFNRANFASQWYAGVADRIHNELPSWNIGEFELSNFVLKPPTVTFWFRTTESPGSPRQPRLFVYMVNPARKGPPQSYKNTMLARYWDGPFVDGRINSIVLNLPFWMLPATHYTIMTRVATDAGYGKTQWIEGTADQP